VTADPRTPSEQLALLQERVRRARTKAPEGLAELDPVAQVVVDVPLPHLDRTFDYAVPASMADAAQPGVRVRVRFAGRLVDGWVVARARESTSERTLARLQRVVSSDLALTPEILALARAVADRYAGTLPDVLRSAVPPRHAATEAAFLASAPTVLEPVPAPTGDGGWSAYAGGDALLAQLRAPAGAPAVRAAWTALPGQNWAGELAHLAATSAAAGRSAVLVAPNARDVHRLDAALTAALGKGRHVVLTADLSPARRYRAFLKGRHGRVPIVVGTRAAVFAPVPDLGLLVLWDDGDDSLAEPRAPYWHAREVLSLRAQHSGAALVIGSVARSVDVARSVRTGWLTDVVAPRAAVRGAAPLVRALGGDAASEVELSRDAAARTARLPHEAFTVARDALTRGPVLVQVPRRGYLPGLACQRCREPARCSYCAGPLQLLDAGAVPVCRWCARAALDWRCPNCAGDRLRASSTGSRRTADELGRAFRGVTVVTSGRDPDGAGVRDTVGPAPALVVATPGAEPVAEGGYAAALLLDGRVLLDRPDVRAGEEAVRRWLSAASLVRPAGEGGVVVLLADAALGPAQAVLRWDPEGYADRELDVRIAAGLPPAARVAELVGAGADVAALLDLTRLPASARVLGPVPLAQRRTGEDPERVRALVTVPPGDGASLAAELRAAAGVRSARKDGGPVTVRIDPAVLE
jgi:primosomal protein N' (replication factor Y)